MKRLLFLLLIPFIIVYCTGESTESKKEADKKVTKIEIVSPAFGNGENIPPKYTCDGENISPEIQWCKLPEEVNSLALIVEDPDAPMGTWIHWVIYNIPAVDSGKIKQGVPKADTLENEILQGITDFKEVGYGGPCPPGGSVHHYHFILFGLDTELNIPSGLTADELRGKMKHHIITKGELIGLYSRK